MREGVVGLLLLLRRERSRRIRGIKAPARGIALTQMPCKSAAGRSEVPLLPGIPDAHQLRPGEIHSFDQGIDRFEGTVAIAMHQM